MEYPIDFHNQNQKLYGILHVPDKKEQSGIGINLLCPGIKHRVGPHRLNVKIARTLCAEGFYVLRFDPAGVGDSEGTLPSGEVSEIWQTVQLGRFVSDTLAANDYFAKEANINSVCLGGLCGGAITGILTAKEDPRVSHLLLIDLPVTVTAKPLEFCDMIVPGEYSDHLLALYFKKLMDPRSLLRFLTFKSDLTAIRKLLNIQFRKMKGPFGQSSRNLAYPPNFNFKLVEAFEECVRRGVKMLFVLAGNDYSTGEFEQMFEGPVLRKNPKAQSLSTIHKIKKANHSYTLSEWQIELFERIKVFMEQNEK